MEVFSQENSISQTLLKPWGVQIGYHGFFKDLSSHKEELATLLTENFEITGKSFSQTWFVWV